MKNRLTRTLTFGLLLQTVVFSAQADIARPRIVGGNGVDIAEVPATVALLNTNRLAQTGSFFQSQFCGATVIAPRWVLTAAHCLVTSNGVTSANEVSVLMGSTDLDRPTNSPVNVRRIIVHEDYRASAHANDIALIELGSDALVSAATLDVAPVTVNDVAFIAGWGALGEAVGQQPQSFPTQLQGAYVRMIPGADCGELFPVYQGRVDSRQLCAGLAGGGVDTCQGDSGGPIYRMPAQGAPQTLTVSGVTSWGFGCANAESPGVYTRVAAYTSWIRRITDQSTPVVVATNPDNTQFLQDAPGNPVQSSGGSAGFSDIEAAVGSSAWFLPMMSLIALCLRRARRLSTFLMTKKRSIRPGYALLIAVPAVILLVSPLSAEYDLTPPSASLTQAFGNSRDEVIGEVTPLWKSNPACTMTKTGYSSDRRSYFLESCSFNNASGKALYDVIPLRVEYRFFEHQLVQVIFELEQLQKISISDTVVVADIHQLSN